MICFDNLSKRYPGGFEALKNVSFEMAAGEMAFLTGHSGAGKSTLLKMLMLMERPTSGNLLINGKNLNRLPNSQIPIYRRQVGVVFQNHQLLLDRTVFDNVALPLQVSGYPANEIGRRVRAALDGVGLLDKEQQKPVALSGGEQQRVGIARAVVHKPRILLADEPTGNLDPELSSEIMALFRRFQNVGVTVLIATHDVNLIDRMQLRIMRLEGGTMIDDGADCPREAAQRGASGQKIKFADRWRGYKSHHRDTIRISLLKMMREPVQTLMTVAVIAIALALPTALYLTVENIQRLGSNFESSAQITVYVQNGAKPEAIKKLQDKLENLPAVDSVSYISAEQALLEFKALSGFGSALRYLEDNPLPAVFLVQPIVSEPIDLAQTNNLIASIADLPGVEDVQIDMQWLQRLHSLTEVGHKVVLALGATLGLGVLLVIGNTIRLAIQSRRDEIIVVKLVGGTNAYVRRPFLYNGVLLGLFGALAASIMLYLSVVWISSSIADLADLYQSQYRLAGLGFLRFLMLMCLGGLFGLAGAWMAVSKHLKDIEPK